MYKKTILKNGLTILEVPIRGAKSVLVDVFVKVGSRNEDKRVNGISHFLEHLFFKGSKRFPTAQDLSHALDAIGAEYNANTGKEHTQYYIKAAKKHFRFIFETLTDVLQNPVFAPEEIEREKGVIIEEINMYEDTPMRHVEDVLEEVMWPDQPLGRNIAGTKEVIRRTRQRDITGYVKTFYKPQNMIIAVTGSYNRALLRGLLTKHWAGVPSAVVPLFAAARSAQKAPAVKLETKPTEQYHLALGFRSYDHNHPDYIPQIVLSAILGGGMSSRLFTEVRERRGLAYYVRAQTGNYRDTGNFVIAAGLARGALTDATKVIMAEVQKLKNENVSDRELHKVKEYLKGTLTLSLEESEALLSWYLEQIAFRSRVLEPESAFAAIDRVNVGDVRRVARDIFQARKLSLAIVGPKGDGRALRSLLKM